MPTSLPCHLACACVTVPAWCVCVLCRQLAANIDAATDLQQLQVLISRHAHQMNGFLFARAITRTPQVGTNVSCLGALPAADRVTVKLVI